MSIIVNIDCFKGFHHLPSSCKGEGRLQDYIDRYEDEYLRTLLGSELYQLFIDDLVDGVPQNQDYLDWFNPFHEEIIACCVQEKVKSKGVKDMLTGFIYYHYVHSSQMRQTQTGTTIQRTNNSMKVGFLNNERDAEARYNEAVESYNAIITKLGRCDTLDYKLLDIL